MSRKRRKPKARRSSSVRTEPVPPRVGAAPGPDTRGGPEPWARVGYVLVALGLGLFVLLASRPGGRLAIAGYRFGPTLLGLSVGLVLAYGLVRAVLTRPVLQRGRLGTWLALGAVFWLASFPLAYPSSHEGRPSRVPFALPGEGAWRVVFAGDRRETNPWVLTPDRRFGVVLEPAPGTEPPGLRAPADGRIHSLPAAGPGEGRTIVLEVAEAEFLFLGPVVPAVSAGDEVRAGDPLGEVAASPRPALSIHLQDTPEPGWGEGIPLRFHDLTVDGSNAAQATLRAGQTVSTESGFPAPEPR